MSVELQGVPDSSLMGYLVPLLGSLPGLRRAFFSIMLARFRA
jgi:hypothetical protein